ncbi:nucleolar protein 14-like [Diaphorina citri]|uniref:Nucleolar protein 14-like n=1 Tax=Diaphorina citri TaxID=121845 RepID=A0A3Q0J5I3_DIACI|nr:nucleolar protein 14-like [Diaphorina citri]
MDPDSAGSYVRGVIQEKYQTYARRDSRFPSVHSGAMYGELSRRNIKPMQDETLDFLLYIVLDTYLLPCVCGPLREADESMEEENVQSKERKGSKRKLEDDNEEEDEESEEEDEESEEEDDEDEDEGSEEDEDSFDDLVDNEDSDDSSDESETERNEALTKSSSEAKNKSKLKSNEDKTSETKSGKADETKPSKTPDERTTDKKKKVTKESDQETPLETNGKETRGVKTGEKNSSSGAGKKSLRFTESETDEENGKVDGKSSKRKADRKTESQEHMEQYTESEKDKRDGETKGKDTRDEETKGKDKKDGETKGKDKRNDEPKGILKNVRNQNEEEELRNVRAPSEEKISSELTQLGTELPFTFDIPGEYEEMVALFQGRTVKEVKVILERMIKVNHWSLGGDNKARLSQLFAFLLQYSTCEIRTNGRNDNINFITKCWKVLNALSPILFDLCLMDPDSAGGYVRGVIQEKYQTYARRDSRFPSVHSVSNNCYSNCPHPLSAADLFSTERNPSTLFKLKILRSLLHLLAILVDKYSHYDASYLIFSNMEAILRQICSELSSEGETSKASGEKEKIVEEGKANGVNNAGKTKANSENEKSNGKETKDVGKATSGETPTKKGRKGKKQKSKPDQTVENEEVEKKEENKKVETEKGEHIKKENLNRKERTKKESQAAALDAPSDPTSLADQLLAEITAALDLLSRTKTAHPFTYVAKEKEKPKILRLFEPEIKPVLKFHTKGSQKEREKLLHKYKKEMKGAIREIRKDGRFISKVKLREQTRRDEERKRKVKEILGGCAQQEGEIRNLKRKKK